MLNLDPEAFHDSRPVERDIRFQQRWSDDYRKPGGQTRWLLVSIALNILLVSILVLILTATAMHRG